MLCGYISAAQGHDEGGTRNSVTPHPTLVLSSFLEHPWPLPAGGGGVVLTQWPARLGGVWVATQASIPSQSPGERYPSDGRTDGPAAPTDCTHDRLQFSFLLAGGSEGGAARSPPCNWGASPPFLHAPPALISGSTGSILAWLAVVGSRPPSPQGETGRAPTLPSGHSLPLVTIFPPFHPGFRDAGWGAGKARVCHRGFGVAEPREDI